MDHEWEPYTFECPICYGPVVYMAPEWHRCQYCGLKAHHECVTQHELECDESPVLDAQERRV